MLSITLQRYKFLSKSQLDEGVPVHPGSCRLPYKGTNFSANHNTINCLDNKDGVVDYLTKVQISQQITTRTRPNNRKWQLSITLQRYKFLSKSQQLIIGSFVVGSCRLPYKGTNFSANHNVVCRVPFGVNVVDYLTKVQISQQITTVVCVDGMALQLSITLQRYKFLSKSQRNIFNTFALFVVDYLTKVQISQQITTNV